MSNNLARARETVRKAAINWIEMEIAARQDDDRGDPRVFAIYSGSHSDSADRFLREFVIDAFAEGYGQADVEFTIERATGQRQLDDAGALMRETAELLRGYEAAHRAKEQAATRERGGLAAEEAMSRRVKAERNALAAARLEAWLRGEDRYPVAVEHRQSAGQIGEAFASADWTPVPGMPEPTNVVDLTPCAGRDRVAGEMVPGEDTVVAHGEPTAPWRLEGVADLASVRLNTGDPRFDPAGPVTVNGFLYVPAKENDHG